MTETINRNNVPIPVPKDETTSKRKEADEEWKKTTGKARVEVGNRLIDKQAENESKEIWE